MRKWFCIGRQRLALALLLGICGGAIGVFNIGVPIGQTYVMNPWEILLTLGAALTGPAGAGIIAVIFGLTYHPVRNIPSHVIAGIAWAFIYFLIWKFAEQNRNKRVYILVLWVVAIPLYYFGLLIPLDVLITATLIIPSSFDAMYIQVAGAVLPEVLMTVVVTVIALALIPIEYLSPEQWCGKKQH